MIGFLLLAQLGLGNPGNLYLPSPDQQRIDRSFSMIPIDTLLLAARPRLVEQKSGDCALAGDCVWKDRDGVRYEFQGDNANRRYLIAKSVRASDFVWKSIPALGIGQARDRAMVMAAVGRYVRGAQFDCGPAGQTGPARCRAPLKPGHVTIDFDAAGKLVEARFVGYDLP